MAEVTVGPDKTKFFVHERVFGAHSPFAKAAFSDKWTGGDGQKTMTIEDTTKEAFELYLHYIYTGRLSDDASDGHGWKKFKRDLAASETDVLKEIESKRIINVGHARLALLIKAYLLGQFVQDGAFRSTVIDAMVYFTLAAHVVATSTGSQIYDNTVSGSPIRKFLVDQHVYHGLLIHVRKSKPPYDMLLDIVDESKKKMDAGQNNSMTLAELINKDPCRYHIHEEIDEQAACADAVRQNLATLKVL